ncbi:MAG TPA: hypothetical protein VFD73_16755, partial [Gemmatimonadales bacterium]|nr:hypothetical protein [Gemmatimonadales bacterium]
MCFECANDPGDLADAVALYQDPFLDGFYLSGAEGFERWVKAERVGLPERYHWALEQLTAGADAWGDPAAAAEWWRRNRAAGSPLAPGRPCVGRGLRFEEPLDLRYQRRLRERFLQQRRRKLSVLLTKGGSKQESRACRSNELLGQ